MTMPFDGFRANGCTIDCCENRSPVRAFGRARRA